MAVVGIFKFDMKLLIDFCCNFVEKIEMNRQILIDNTIHKIMQLPDVKIQEINDFVDFLLSRIDDHIIKEGVEKLNSDSKSFYYLREEEDLYTVNDLKEHYK